MKKLLFITMFLVSLGVFSQTNYSPTILYKEIPYPLTDDTLVRVVKQNIKAWNNKEMIIHLVAQEYANKGDDVPWREWDFSLSQLMDSTYTHTRDGGNQVTMTGREFVETIFEGGAINWELWQELGRSIYFTFWDTNQKFIRKE